MTNKGRTKGQKKKVTLILTYNSWKITHEPYNYVISRDGTNRIYFYPSIEGALQGLFTELILDNIEQDKTYNATLQDLGRIIKGTKKEIHQLLQIENKNVEIETTKGE